MNIKHSSFMLIYAEVFDESPVDFDEAQLKKYLRSFDIAYPQILLYSEERVYHRKLFNGTAVSFNIFFFLRNCS